VDYATLIDSNDALPRYPFAEDGVWFNRLSHTVSVRWQNRLGDYCHAEWPARYLRVGSEGASYGLSLSPN